MLTQEHIAPAAPGEKPLVLVVDDEYGPRESIAFSLAAEFAVETAGRANEALAKLHQAAWRACESVVTIMCEIVPGWKIPAEMHRLLSAKARFTRR